MAKIPFCWVSKVPFRVVLFLLIWCLVTMRTLLAVIAERVELVRRLRVDALHLKARSEKIRKFLKMGSMGKPGHHNFEMLNSEA